MFSTGRCLSQQPAFPTSLWHVHNCRTQSCLKWCLPFESLLTDLEFSCRITLVPGFGAMEMKSCFLDSVFFIQVGHTSFYFILEGVFLLESGNIGT